METRSVPEWIGKHPDTAVPPRVRLRVLAKFGNQCALCHRAITDRRWVCDHTVAIVNGGANRETNLQPICESCDTGVKTPADVAIKSKVHRSKMSHFLKKKPSGRPMPGTKASGLKKKMNGEVVRR